MTARRFLMFVEYKGAPFVGWQRQKEGLGVQEVLETAVKEFCGQDIRVNGCGRTDAGVNALAMPAHIDLDLDVTPERIMAALNAKMRPHPVAVLKVQEVAPTFHARFSCVGRTYIYKLVNRRAPLTFEAGTHWIVHSKIDADKMREAAAMLIGHHDFSTFRAAACQAKTPVKTLDELSIIDTPMALGGQAIDFKCRARSFLHNQVRAMVGSLVHVGTGHWSIDQFADAFAALDRTRGGQNAPPEGLYFAAAKFD